MTEVLCACGRPLHYSSPTIQEQMEKIVAASGERIAVTREGRTWLVPRHYIALHGLQSEELPYLGFEEVTE